MKKKWLYIIVGVAVLGTAGYFYISNGSSKDVKYRTEKLTRGDVVVQVRATGTINPIQTVHVGSQVSGTISALYADFNSQVHKGQVIAVIDSTFLSASVKEAQANLERNQAGVNEAKRTYDRTSELYKKDLVAQADLDAAQTNYESAVAQLKQTQAALDRQVVNLRFAVIRAPIDGVIISRDVDVGQTVAASLSAPQIFSIANDLKLMRVEASVDEADIGQVKTGQDVSFTVDSYADEQFHGTVSQVRLAPVAVQNVVTYTVIIDVPNEELKLRPGMTATVSILINQRQNVLRVSSLALRFQPPTDVMEKIQASQSKPDTTPVAADTANARMRTGDRSQDTSRRGQGGERRWNRDGGGGGGGGQRMAGGGMGRGGRSGMGRVWVMDDAKNLRFVMVRTGLNDNRYVEILGDALQEGDQIVLGIQSGDAPTASAANGQNNPFAPRVQGGGGGGGGRGR